VRKVAGDVCRNSNAPPGGNSIGMFSKRERSTFCDAASISSSVDAVCLRRCGVVGVRGVHVGERDRDGG
jgi:hypothetical protein